MYTYIQRWAEIRLGALVELPLPTKAARRPQFTCREKGGAMPSSLRFRIAPCRQYCNNMS